MSEFKYIFDDSSQNDQSNFLKEIAYQLKRIADGDRKYVCPICGFEFDKKEAALECCSGR